MFWWVKQFVCPQLPPSALVLRNTHSQSGHSHHWVSSRPLILPIRKTSHDLQPSLRHPWLNKTYPFLRNKTPEVELVKSFRRSDSDIAFFGTSLMQHWKKKRTQIPAESGGCAPLGMPVRWVNCAILWPGWRRIGNERVNETTARGISKSAISQIVFDTNQSVGISMDLKYQYRWLFVFPKKSKRIDLAQPLLPRILAVQTCWTGNLAKLKSLKSRQGQPDQSWMALGLFAQKVWG